MKNEKIILLKGPDRVRKRAAIFFGSVDVAGAQNAVLELLNIFLREAQLGFCRHIRVKQNGATLEVSGDDRGIDLGQDTGDDTKWKNIFCQLFAASAYPPDESAYSLGLTDSRHHALYGDPQKPEDIYFPGEQGYMELYALQCVSEKMEVSVNRKGIHSTLSFSKGEVTRELETVPTTEPDGTTFRFTLDSAVFTETDISFRFFLEKLDLFAALCPGLTCAYRDDGGKESTFCYPGGIRDYVGGATPVFCNKIEGKGRERYNRPEYCACVEVAVGLADRKGSTRSIHNFKELSHGGPHLEALKKRICSAFNSCYWKDAEILQKKPLTYGEIENHLSVVVATWCSPTCTNWENGTQMSLKNQVITDMTQDAVDMDFSNYLYENKEKYRPMVDKILAYRRKLWH